MRSFIDHVRYNLRTDIEYWRFTHPTRTLFSFPWAGAVWDMIRVSWCYIHGHSYEPDGIDFPESGGEGFTCRRCGCSFIAWH